MCYNNLKFSKMTLDDLKNISNILISEFDDFWNANTFETELQNENSYYLCGKIDDKIIGFVGIKSVLDEADIMNIVVRKDLRNSGLGSSLLKKIIEYAKLNGITKITLEVSNQNMSAIHLYKKFNFKEIAIRKNYYGLSNDAIIMQLHFGDTSKNAL